MHDLRPVMFTVPGEPVGKGRPRIGRVGAHAVARREIWRGFAQ